MDDLRDYQLSFDPANETASEPLILVIDEDKMRQSLDEWWNNYELALEEYIEDMGGTDGPSKEDVHGA